MGYIMISDFAVASEIYVNLINKCSVPSIKWKKPAYLIWVQQSFDYFINGIFFKGME